MNLVKKFTYSKLQKTLLGKRVHFTSDCQLFPNFDIKGKVVSISLSSGIPLIKVILDSGRNFTIDGGMSNLSFELLN